MSSQRPSANAAYAGNNFRPGPIQQSRSQRIGSARIDVQHTEPDLHSIQYLDGLIQTGQHEIDLSHNLVRALLQ